MSALAIDIGGTNTKAGMVDNAGTVGDSVVLPTRGPDPALFLDQLAAAVSPLIPGSRAGAGVSVAGFLDDDRAALKFNPNIAWLQAFPLRAELQRRLGIPVELEVDSNAAALAEWRFGTGRGSNRFLCITSGTGIGGGLILNGQLVRIAQGCIGDAGHVIVEPDGRECSCGGHGCAEALATAPFVVDYYRESGGSGTIDTAAGVIEAARKGDPKALAALALAGRYLGVALASLANVFFPDTIAVGGGLSEAGDLLLAPAVEMFHRSTGPFAGAATIVRAALGWQAALVGAAMPFLNAA